MNPYYWLANKLLTKALKCDFCGESHLLHGCKVKGLLK